MDILDSTNLEVKRYTVFNLKKSNNMVVSTTQIKQGRFKRAFTFKCLGVNIVPVVVTRKGCIKANCITPSVGGLMCIK